MCWEHLHSLWQQQGWVRPCPLPCQPGSVSPCTSTSTSPPPWWWGWGTWLSEPPLRSSHLPTPWNRHGGEDEGSGDQNHRYDLLIYPRPEIDMMVIRDVEWNSYIYWPTHMLKWTWWILGGTTTHLPNAEMDMVNIRWSYHTSTQCWNGHDEY